MIQNKVNIKTFLSITVSSTTNIVQFNYHTCSRKQFLQNNCLLFEPRFVHLSVICTRSSHHLLTLCVVFHISSFTLYNILTSQMNNYQFSFRPQDPTSIHYKKYPAGTLCKSFFPSSESIHSFLPYPFTKNKFPHFSQYNTKVLDNALLLKFRSANTTIQQNTDATKQL